MPAIPPMANKSNNLAFFAAACLLLASPCFGQMGPLVPSSSNPNFFMRPDGKVIVLSGTQTWDTMQNTSESSTPEVFDFTAYVNFLSAHGHNTTILWHKDLPKYCNWGADNGGSTWYMTLWPWNRNGGPGAGDGGQKFDFTSSNPAFYTQLLARVQQLEAAGIYPIVELFDGLGLTNNRCGSNVDGYPFSAGNNVNGIADDTALSSMTMTSQNAILDTQDAYVKRVIDTLHAEPGVLWEISEEAPCASTYWQAHMVSLVHSYESSTYGVNHPVGYPTLNISCGSDSTLYDSNADWVAPKNVVSPTSSCGSGSPACKVNLNDSDHSYFGMWTATQQAQRQWVWENFANGNGLLYMDPYLIWWSSGNRNDCDGGVRPANAVCTTPVNSATSYQENIRRNLGYVATYGNTKMNLANDTPHPSLCQTGYCLANNVSSGAEFLVYFPYGGSNWVNLSAQNGKDLSVLWMDPSTGNTTAGTYTATSSTQQTFTPPSGFSSDAVLLLTSSASAPPSPPTGLTATVH